MTNWQKELENSAIPKYMHGAIVRWIENGIPPGNFLSAVLCNDLREACVKADDTNRGLLWEYVAWFDSNAPADCWGSREIFKGWDGMHAAPARD